MFNKVLFLDCDGVLNKIGTKIKQPNGVYGVEPRMAAQLKRIVDQTNCDIVLSSSWRKHNDCVEYLFSAIDPSVRRAVIGKTPVLEGDVVRGDEIQRWIDLNGGVKNFVILDDDADMGHLMPQLVQTDTFVGLTPELADKCIERLNLSIEISDDASEEN